MSVRFLAVVVLATVFFSIGPSDPACQPRPPEADAHHRSGLSIAPGRGPCHESVDDRLGLAYDRAYRFAEAHPNDLGYPWDDRGNLTLVVSVVTTQGRVLADQWSGLGWQVPIRTRTVTRSFADLEGIKHDLIDIARMGFPGSEDIRFTTGDSEHNRVIIGVQRLSDQVAAAIVARYGTQAVAVLIDPRYGPFSLRD